MNGSLHTEMGHQAYRVTAQHSRVVENLEEYLQHPSQVCRPVLELLQESEPAKRTKVAQVSNTQLRD